jgi:hypothetical protein
MVYLVCNNPLCETIARIPGRAVSLHTADKYPRLIRQPLQGQKGMYEKALMASSRSAHPW